MKIVGMILVVCLGHVSNGQGMVGQVFTDVNFNGFYGGFPGGQRIPIFLPNFNNFPPVGRSNNQVGRYTNVGPGVSVGRGSSIGNYCNIQPNCAIGDNVRVHNYVNMGPSNEIGNNCDIMSYANTGAECKMGPNSKMQDYSMMSNNVNVGSGCIMDKYSSVGPNAKIEPNACLGQYSSVGPNATVGENAVIQKYAKVPKDGMVEKNDVVIRTPSSAELYSNCMPIDRIPPNDVQAVMSQSDQPISPEANNHLRQKITGQMDRLNSNCQRNARSADLSDVPIIKSLYLIMFHGLEGFKQNMQNRARGLNGLNGVMIINGVVYNGNGLGVDNSYGNGNGPNCCNNNGMNELSEEMHFGESAKKNVLEPDVKEKMVELLALEQDSQRDQRVPEDTFCKMCAEVQSKQRKVKCDQ